MQVKYDLVVDFARPTKSNTIIIAEGDANSRVAHFVLLANKLPMQMTDVTVATVKAIKDDGSVIFGDARIIEDEYGNKLNEVEYIIPASMTDYAGNVTMTISLMSSMNELITSWEFYLKVRNALYNEDDYVSESDLSGFRDLLNRSEAAVKKIEEMTAQNALPNPYPLNINLEGEDITYSGRETVDIELVNMAYIGEAKGYEEPIDESAAGAAAESARQAKESADNAYSYKDTVELLATSARESAEVSASAKNSAEGFAGQSEAYRNQCANYSANAESYANEAKTHRDETLALIAETPNWNETDNTKHSYVKNKPFNTLDSDDFNVEDGVLKAKGGNNNVYSLDEVEVGTWIDGAKIYQKTYEFLSPSQASKNTIYDLDVEIDTCIECRAFIVAANSTVFQLSTATTNVTTENYFQGWIRGNLHSRPNSFSCIVGSVADWINRPMYLTIKYTKVGA